MTRKMNKKYIATFLLAVLLSSLIFYYIGLSSQPVWGDSLQVEIQPDGAKLFPNEHELFMAVVYNGTTPFTYTWKVNGTSVNCSEPTFDFSFKERCNYVILSVKVTDLHGLTGDASVLVYDPAFQDLPRYLESTLPASYIIDTNTTHTYCFNGTTWKLDESSGSNRSLPIQNAIDNLTAGDGGLIFVRAGNYTDVSVTVKNNVLLMLEVGVTGFFQTTTGTGIAMKYSNGYAYLYGPLNMTGHQIVFGVFHSGTTLPSNPTEAQWFYRTTDHILYVWNSTAWVNCFQGGTGGSSHDTHQDYSYLIYASDSTFYMKNGTTENNDWSNTDEAEILQACIGNLTNGGRIVCKDDMNFGSTTIILPQDSARNLIIEGETEQVYVTSSASKVFDFTEDDWEGGYFGPSRVILRNFRIEHNTQSSSDVGLDLYYGYACLENIRIENANNTKQGTGIIVGPKGGSLETWYENVRVRWYDIGINHSMALCNFRNVRVVRPATCAWLILDSASWTMTNVGGTLETGGSMDVFQFGSTGTISGIITEVRCEGLPSTGYIFNLPANTYVDVYGVFPESADWKPHVCNNYDRINIISSWTYARTYNGDTETVTSGSDYWVVAHGLCGTPAYEGIWCMPLWDTTWYIYSRNSTHFRVNFGTAPSGDKVMGWHAQLWGQ